MKIQPQTATESSRLYGRHFDHKDELCEPHDPAVHRHAQGELQDELTKDDWRLVVELKKKFEMHTGEPM